MKQKDLLILLIPMFLVTVLWVIFNIYHNHVSSTITDPLTVQIIPIDGNFNRASLESIKDRKRTEPLFIAPVKEVDETTPTISPTPTAQATGTASPSAAPVNQEGL